MSSADTNPPSSDRLSGIEARLDKLTGALTQVVQTTAHKQQSDEAVTKAARVVADAEAKVTSAKQALATAYESGDANQIADATAKVASFATEAAAARMNLSSVRARQNAPAQPPSASAQTQAQRDQQRVDDSNLREFKQRNDWYDTDPDMTIAAKEAHDQIKAEGKLDVGSRAYFNAIESRVRAKFPDKLWSAPSGGFTPSKGSQMQNRADEPHDRISASVADGYRRMGIDIDKPEVAKAMVAARRTAVEKGFLPEKPVTERIITR